ncbi:MAG TPA: hypothetical protein VM008_21685 [Phycisphaerae bacterium]|nr:hypothetical protein [Phycisphaerae bacterium]
MGSELLVAVLGFWAWSYVESILVSREVADDSYHLLNGTMLHHGFVGGGVIVIRSDTSALPTPFVVV